MNMSTAVPQSPRRRGGWWWLHSSDGQLAVWQTPNPALWVWLGTLAVGLAPLSTDDQRRVRDIGHGALIVWAIDEIVRGASPFRRALGAVVLIGQLIVVTFGT